MREDVTTVVTSHIDGWLLASKTTLTDEMLSDTPHERPVIIGFVPSSGAHVKFGPCTVPLTGAQLMNIGLAASLVANRENVFPDTFTVASEMRTIDALRVSFETDVCTCPDDSIAFDRSVHRELVGFQATAQRVVGVGAGQPTDWHLLHDGQVYQLVRSLAHVGGRTVPRHAVMAIADVLRCRHALTMVPDVSTTVLVLGGVVIQVHHRTTGPVTNMVGSFTEH